MKHQSKEVYILNCLSNLYLLSLTYRFLTVLFNILLSRNINSMQEITQRENLNYQNQFTTVNDNNEFKQREFGKDITNTVNDGTNTMYRKSQEMKENRENYYKQPLVDKSVFINI